MSPLLNANSNDIHLFCPKVVCIKPAPGRVIHMHGTSAARGFYMTPILICREGGAASRQADYEHIDTFKCPKCDATFTIFATAGKAVPADVLAWARQLSQDACDSHPSSKRTVI